MASDINIRYSDQELAGFKMLIQDNIKQANMI